MDFFNVDVDFDGIDPYKYICSPFLMGGVFFLSLIWVYRDPLVVLSISVILSIFLQILVYILKNDELDNFCSIDRNRWCPEKDRCLPEVQKQEKVHLFLDDTDKFIKELYQFVQPDAPEYAGPEDILKNDRRIAALTDPSPDRTAFVA